MFQLNYKLLIVLAATLVIQSCATKQYTWVFTTQKPTYFEKRNDCEFSFNGAQIGELHGAYAITNFLALSATGAWGAAGNENSEIQLFDVNGTNIGVAEYGTQIQDLDFSIGYFKPLNDDWQFELFAGTAFVSSTLTETITLFDTNEPTETVIDNGNLYKRYYVQPAIGKNHRNYDFGAVARCGYIDYATSNDDIMFEPAIFVRYGFRNLKIMGQTGLRLNTHNGFNDYPLAPITLGVGLYLQFNQNNKKN